jgi:hypothetical protein
MLLHIGSSAGFTIDTHESSFRKRQVPNRHRDLSSATNIPSECRIAIIGSHDAMILPHDANPGQIKFFGKDMVLERDHNMDLRFAAIVGFVLYNDAHYDFRILCARLRPLVLNNLQLFGLCEHSLHKYRPLPFPKSYPDVVVVQPGQDWNGDNGHRSAGEPPSLLEVNAGGGPKFSPEWCDNYALARSRHFLRRLPLRRANRRCAKPSPAAFNLRAVGRQAASVCIDMLHLTPQTVAPRYNLP